jgi:phage-related tail protein
LIVPIALGVAGIFGLGKTVKAFVDNNEANDIAKSAQSIVADAERALATAKAVCNEGLKQYGDQKIGVVNVQVREFVNAFGQLKNVRLSHSPELDRLAVGDFTEVSLDELRHTCSFVSDLATSAATGVGAGAVTAFGAYGGTMMLASAGTGTAIGTLSGVAATNATLAWLGGGTLAAGGYGVAGGTMVLGVLVAGPALLVLGGVLGAQASKKLDEARANREKALTFDAETRVVLEKLNAIVAVTSVGRELLANLQERLGAANATMKDIIRAFGVDFSTYPDDAKDCIFKAVTYAQLVKKVVDTPILAEDGSLAETSVIGFTEAKSLLEA